MAGGFMTRRHDTGAGALRVRAVGSALALILAAACVARSSPQGQGPTAGEGPPPGAAAATAAPAPVSGSPVVPPPPSDVSASPDPVIVAVGDIACGGRPGTAGLGVARVACETKDVTELVVGRDYDMFLPLGEMQFPYGTVRNSLARYDPFFGSEDAADGDEGDGGDGDGDGGGGPGADGSGSGPGGPGGERPAPAGFTSWDLGRWHIVALNTGLCFQGDGDDDRTARVRAVPRGGCRPGEPQYEWLRRDLEMHPDNLYPCTLAFFEHPLFAVGAAKASGAARPQWPLWKLLHDAGVDVVLNGHRGNYQRWFPVDPQGRAAQDGITEFIVGTGGGGRELVPPAETWPAELAFARSNTEGVLEMTLEPDGYSFRFVTVPADATIVDEGSASCHGVPVRSGPVEVSPVP